MLVNIISIATNNVRATGTFKKTFAEMRSGGHSRQGGACDPESAGGLYIEKPKHFKRKFVDRITSFCPECGHTLELDPNE